MLKYFYQSHFIIHMISITLDISDITLIQRLHLSSLTPWTYRLSDIYHLGHIGYHPNPTVTSITIDVSSIILGKRLHHFHPGSFGYSDVITVSINFNGSADNSLIIGNFWDFCTALHCACPRSPDMIFSVSSVYTELIIQYSSV